MVRLSRLSTLFPYTTLFRSRSRRRSRRRPVADRLSLRGKRSPRLDARRRASRDRKSTRLNSSHVSIPYAVFCLQKKSVAASTSRRTDVSSLLDEVDASYGPH